MSQRLERASFPALGVFAVACVALFLGWRLFWFLTDDAYISFRYVHNEIAGRGLVWNPPPFRPVEGYTSFAWVVLLDLTWRVFGVEPPVAANWLGLGFGYGTLSVVTWTLFRVELPEPQRKHRVLLVALTLVGLLSNGTFLAWLSSGLETSLFNFLASAWLVALFFAGREPSRRALSVSCFLATALALTRPDGLLFCAGSAVWVGLVARKSREPRALITVSPFLLVALHLLWRFDTYGVWLPNTYYAKHVSAWPESGARYLGSFVIEYALYVPCVILVVWAIRRWRSSSERFAIEQRVLLGLAVLAIHVGYYTFVVGGDHFEYRVYSYLVPWLWLGTLLLVTRAFELPRSSIAALLSCLVLSWPIPWAHWIRTHDKLTRHETELLTVPLAGDFPAPFRSLVGLWDEWQAWLIRHFVCQRHQEHKVYRAYQLDRYPPRSAGLAMSWAERDVFVENAVGVPGWVLPNVAVIDGHGLNDFVIARNPPEGGGLRRMAHERKPPPRYVECFDPNVTIVDGKIVLHERTRPLSDARIRECERRFVRR